MLKNFWQRIKEKDYKLMRWVFTRMFILIFIALVVMILLFMLIIVITVEDNPQTRDVIEPHTWLIVAAAVLSLLIISQFVALLWIKRITRPAEEISKAVEKVAKGDFDVKIDCSGFKYEMLDLGENLNKMIEELNSIELMRSDFVSNVSHEFRAPLSTIQGYVTLLSSPQTTEEKKSEYFQLLRDSTRQLSSLVDNVLKLSRLQSQNILPQKSNFSLDEQLRRAVLMFEQDWSEKELDLDLDLPECQYCGNGEMLSQVWTNLIGNAVKFSRNGGKIGVKLDDSQPNYISVTISDNGEGMSEDVKKHIFEKFYQGDTSRKSEGNGLGLALVKSICQLTGSEISVESQEGVGSSFTVRLKR